MVGGEKVILKIHVCTEDGELLESVDVNVSTNPQDIKLAKMEAGDAIDQAIRVLIHRAVHGR